MDKPDGPTSLVPSSSYSYHDVPEPGRLTGMVVFLLLFIRWIKPGLLIGSINGDTLSLPHLTLTIPETEPEIPFEATRNPSRHGIMHYGLHIIKGYWNVWSSSLASLSLLNNQAGMKTCRR